MKIGVSYPTTEVAGDGQAIRAFVRAAEDLGYDHIMAYDHVVTGPLEQRDPPLTGPYTEKDSFHDPFTFFAFAAALTERLEFATGVLVLPQRQTAVVAQQAADIDLFSNERLRLGVGIGWNHVEYAALGQNFKTRARRLEEQIGLLRLLWTRPLVSFEGQFDRIDRAAINPRPRRSVPIWMGGYSEPAYERGARLGDGFLFAASGADAAAAWGRVKDHLALIGRSEQGFGRDLLTIFARGCQQSADDMRIWRDAGGTHGTIQSMQQGLGSDIRAHVDYIARARRLIDAG